MSSYSPGTGLGTPPWFPKKQWGTKKCCRLVAMLCNNYKTRRVQGSENSQGMWTVKSPALRKRPGGGGSNCKIIGKGQAFNKTVLAGTFYSHSWKTKTAHTCFLIWYLITDRKMKSTRYIPFYPPQWSSSKSLQIVDAGEGLQKREASSASAGDGNCYRHWGAQNGGSLKSWRCKYPVTQQSHTRATTGSNCNWRRHVNPSLHCSTILKPNLEAARKFLERWKGKVAVVHISKGMFLSHRTEGNNAICSNKDGPSHDHSRWIKSDRRGQMPYSITDRWNLKSARKELISKKEIDSQTLKCHLGLQKGSHHEEELDQEAEINMYTLYQKPRASTRTYYIAEGTWLNTMLLSCLVVSNSLWPHGL